LNVRVAGDFAMGERTGAAGDASVLEDTSEELMVEAGVAGDADGVAAVLLTDTDIVDIGVATVGGVFAVSVVAPEIAGLSIPLPGCVGVFWSANSFS